MTQIHDNVAPYYNDYDEKKNFHKVLFRPGYAVQARELTQLQDILQNQVSKVGDHLFVDGSMIVPGNTVYDLTCKYTKINTAYNGSTVNILALDGVKLKGQTSQTEVQIQAVDSSDSGWFTLVYKVIANGGTTGSNKTLLDNETVLGLDGSGNYTVALASTLLNASTGNSSIGYINEGTFYIGGRFVNVYQQKKILSLYSNQPSIQLGLRVNQVVISETDITHGLSLLDPALGASNYNAPGAHRMQTNLVLTVLQITDDIGPDWIPLLSMQDGNVQQFTNRTVYNELLKTLAKRTFDESGNYTVDEFTPSIREHLGTFNNVGETGPNLNNGLYKTQAWVGSGTLTASSNKITNIKINSGTISIGQTVFENPAPTSGITTYFPAGTYITDISGSTVTMSNNTILISGTATNVQMQGGGNANIVSLGLDAGTAFVGGYEVQTPGTTQINIDKARDFAQVDGASIRLNYGNYLYVGDLFGIPNMSFRSSVELRSGKISVLGQKSGQVIGYAKTLGCEYIIGNETNAIATTDAIYRLYVSDIVLKTGFTMDDVASFNALVDITNGTGTSTISGNVLTQYGLSALVPGGLGSVFVKNDILESTVPTNKVVLYYYDAIFGNVYCKKSDAAALLATGTTSTTVATGGGSLISNMSAPANSLGLQVGQYVFGPGIPTGSYIVATPQTNTTYAANQIRISNVATAIATVRIYLQLNQNTFVGTGSTTGTNTTSNITAANPNIFGNNVKSGTPIFSPTIPNGAYISSVNGSVVTVKSPSGTYANTANSVFSMFKSNQFIPNSSTLKVSNLNISVAAFAANPVSFTVLAGIQDLQIGMVITGGGTVATWTTPATINSIDYNTGIVSVTAPTGGGTGVLGEVLTVANNSSSLNTSATVSSRVSIQQPAVKSLIFNLPEPSIKTATNAAGSAPPPTNFSVRRENVLSAASTTVSWSLGGNEVFGFLNSASFTAYYIAHSTAAFIGQKISFSQLSTPSANTLTISGLTGTSTIVIVATIIKSSVQERVKTLVVGSTISMTVATSKINLNKTDIFRLVAVYDSNDPAINATITSSDITSNWILDNGQRDTHYEPGTLTLKQGILPSRGRLLIVFDYFQHSAGDYFSVDSYKTLSQTYPSNTLGKIPLYTTSSGNIYRLQDCYDFRQDLDTDGQSFIASYTSGSTSLTIQSPNNSLQLSTGDTVSGMGIIDGTTITAINVGGNIQIATLSAAALITAANQPIEVVATGIGTGTQGGISNGFRSGHGAAADMPLNSSDLFMAYSYFLSRIDKIGISNHGKFKIFKGNSSKSPSAPRVNDSETMMILCDLIIPAYTYSASDIEVVLKDNRRYTMRDIGDIDNRVQNLEKITSLTLLEKNTNELLITDTSGLNRFKSGFFVDNFKTNQLADNQNPEYNMAIDTEKGEARPAVSVEQIQMNIDHGSIESNNYVVVGGLAMLPYTEVLAVTQPLATTTINVNPFAVFLWNGTIKLTPSVDTWTDIVMLPDIVHTTVVNRFTTSSFGFNGLVSSVNAISSINITSQR